MMRHLPVVYGEWLLKDGSWEFVVDGIKGARMFLLREGSTHAELVEMAQEDYNMDLNKEVLELTYSVPDVDTPIHVTSDRQVRNLIEITKTHQVRLCVSSRGKGKTVSSGNIEADYGTEVSEKEEEDDVDDVDDVDDAWKEFDNWVENDEGEDDKKKDDLPQEKGKGDEKADVDEAVDEDYELYGKVKDEDEDDDMRFQDFEAIGDSDGAISNHIYVNQSFVSRDALVSALRLTAVKRKFSYKIYKVTKTLLVAKCRVDGCGWKLRASVKHGTNTFWVTKYLEAHTCTVSDRNYYRKHLTPNYIGSLFIDRVGIIDGLTPQHIKDAMRTMFGMHLSYTTSYRALLHAQKVVRGSAEEGYEYLSSYLEQISLANPGSVTSMELDEHDRFKYLFLSFGASIAGLKYQRRVIVVDGTHLSGKYGGVMLVAAAQDGNFQIFPLAFAIVDQEDGPSWEWFFTKLATCVSDQYALVIVSDRHVAIEKACEKVFPWATRGICYYHLQQNIVKQFRGKHLLYLVKGAAYAHTLYDFNRYMNEIRSANPELANYLEEADVALWSRVHCQGDRFNIKTSNIAESINSALKRARGFPIQFLLDFIRAKLGRWFWKRREDALSLTTEHSRGVEKLLAIRSEIAAKMEVQAIDGWRYFVTGGIRDCVVDLELAKCDCGVYSIEKIPCTHAIAAGTFARVHISTLVYSYYSKHYLFSGYSENIYPCRGKLEARTCHPPKERRGPGRQKKSRWRTYLELSRMKGHKPRKLHRPYRCSNCKGTGHTRPHCLVEQPDD